MSTVRLYEVDIHKEGLSSCHVSLYFVGSPFTARTIVGAPPYSTAIVAGLESFSIRAWLCSASAQWQHK